MREKKQRKDRLNGQTDRANHKWSELIEIMNELSDYRAHFVVLLAKIYLEMEREGK